MDRFKGGKALEYISGQLYSYKDFERGVSVYENQESLTIKIMERFERIYPHLEKPNKKFLNKQVSLT